MRKVTVQGLHFHHNTVCAWCKRLYQSGVIHIATLAAYCVLAVAVPQHCSASQVWLLPSFTNEQRSALLAACVAVIYTPQNEHFGIVPLEAMAAGKPVIACSSGGPKESVLPGVTGFLSDPTPGHSAQAMGKLLVGGQHCLPGSVSTANHHHVLLPIIIMCYC